MSTKLISPGDFQTTSVAEHGSSPRHLAPRHSFEFPKLTVLALFYKRQSVATPMHLGRLLHTKGRAEGGIVRSYLSEDCFEKFISRMIEGLAMILRPFNLQSREEAPPLWVIFICQYPPKR